MDTYRCAYIHNIMHNYPCIQLDILPSRESWSIVNVIANVNHFTKVVAPSAVSRYINGGLILKYVMHIQYVCSIATRTHMHIMYPCA